MYLVKLGGDGSYNSHLKVEGMWGTGVKKRFFLVTVCFCKYFVRELGLVPGEVVSF